jgi:hypothetical protein
MRHISESMSQFNRRWLKLCRVVAACAILSARLAFGQTSQLLFDAPGNLRTQTPEIVGVPIILSQPQSQVVSTGELASFSIVLADTRGVGYNWFFNGSPIPGATSDTLLITNVSATNEGQYFVTASNTAGFFVASDLANLYIDSDKDEMPDWWEQMFFFSQSKTATDDFDGDGVSNLQEFLDGTNPTNSASALYRLTLLSDGGAVAVVPDQPSYTNGASVTLTATPSGAEPFRTWTGDAFTPSNTISLTMTNNKTVFAHFARMTLAWTNFNAGYWNNATNWSPNLVPGSNDSAIILNSPTITLNTDADLADFNFGSPGKSPTLTGSGNLRVRGRFTWTLGSMSGTGRTIAEAGSFLTIAASGASIANRTIEIGGTAVFAGGTISMSAAVITNRPGALWMMQSPSSIQFGGRFDNAGTVRVIGTGTAFMGVPFTNYGSVEIQSGTLALSAGASAGTISVPAGATLNFAGGNFNASASSSITGAGQLMVNGAVATLAGLVNLSDTNTFSSGIANLTGNYFCTNNTLLISGGVANFDGTGAVTPSVLNLSGGTLGGASTVTVESVMNWAGSGSMSGTGRTVIPAGITLNIGVPNQAFVASRTLELGGTTLWTGAGSLNLSSAVITNRAGALFDIQSSGSLFSAGGLSRFDNAGTFRKSIGGTTTVSIKFNNFNTAKIQNGTLLLNGGGLNDGAITVPIGTTLNLGGGTFAASPGSSITGPGDFIVSGAVATLTGLVNLSGTHTFSGGTADLIGNYICTNNTLLINGGTANFSGTGPITPAIVNLTGGTLGGSNLVTVSGALNWSGGNMAGNGRTVIPSGVTLSIANSGLLFITGRTLENGGAALWTGTGSIALSSAVITNRAGALFHTMSPGSFLFGGGPSRFDNAGTFRKSASTGATTVESNTSFTNYGTVDIRSGLLAANGGYFSSTNALLNCTLAGKTPGTGYGRLQVSGAVTLNGALSVNLTNGFVPSVGDAFAVVTAGTRNGTFASFLFPSNIVSMQLSNSPTSVVVSITDVSAAGFPPMLLPPQLLGSDLKLTWTAISNASYRVEFNPDPTTSIWSALTGDVTASSSIASKLDALTSSNRFYRVRVLP